MADERKAMPERGKRGQWVGKTAAWALLAGLFTLIIWLTVTWFTTDQPQFWQLPARQSHDAQMEQSANSTRGVATPSLPTLALTSALTSTLTNGITASLPSISAGLDLQPITSSVSTFTSRELVTTTLAAPLADWPNGLAQSVALSADGRWVAFTAPSYITATNGIQTDGLQRERGYDDLYLYDRTEERLIRVTTAPDGTPSNGWVGSPAIAPDGRYLAFYAWSSNLVPGDTNAVQDLFFYDRTTATISRLSMGSGGTQANDRSGDSSRNTRPALSADGRFVAFHSAASNLVAKDDNNRADVFLHDRQTASTTLISRSADGRAANGDSSHPALSADARFVVFQSRATNLDPSVPMLEGPGAYQIYLHDQTTGSTQLISRGPDGRPGNDDSLAPAVAGDGRYVVYASSATNLVPGDSNQVADVFLFDRETGETRRVSVASAGTQANRASWAPQISLDGRYIIFGSEASNLVSGDGNNAADLFLHDQLARHTSRVSVAVRAAWTGAEANGPTQATAAIIPGGRLVAFVSQATNLVDSNASGVPGLYLHERVDAPTFTLAGQVVENDSKPVAGVIVAAGPHRTTTDADGHFRFTTLIGGTYTLAAAKTGYTFSPPRRTISLLRDLDAQDFLAFAGGGADAFLDLPFFYDGSATTLLGVLRDTDEGGWIDAWFDHDAPDYNKNGSILLWDGRWRTQEAYNSALGCYERRCYEGHDGIDFPYRDPNPSTPNIFEPVLVRPAAAGQVAAVVNSCTRSDPGEISGGGTDDATDNNRSDRENESACNGGYGNEVILFHAVNEGAGGAGRSYFTRYSHLATVAITNEGQWLTPEFTLGEMGNTGNSYGTHLHFAVHQDNGNGRWDGEKIDLPVDPFGWEGAEPDPWATNEAGPTSRWLWRFSPTTEAILLGSQGATLRDGVGSVTARIPAGALAGQVRVELVIGESAAPPTSPRRSLGRAFRLQVLDWLQGGSVPNRTAARPVEMSVGFAGAATRHLDLDQLLLYHWREGVGWSPLPTVVDREAQAVIAASDQFGDFDLQAPLLCPADALEPDDSFDAAIFAADTTATWDRLFDVVEDKDWYQVEAVAGTGYQVTVEALASDVSLVVELYDRDGLTRLDTHRGPGILSWTAIESGSYFVRVAPETGSSVGCEVGYRVSISRPGGIN